MSDEEKTCAHNPLAVTTHPGLIAEADPEFRAMIVATRALEELMSCQRTRVLNYLCERFPTEVIVEDKTS